MDPAEELLFIQQHVIKPEYLEACRHWNDDQWVHYFRTEIMGGVDPEGSGDHYIIRAAYNEVGQFVRLFMNSIVANSWMNWTTLSVPDHVGEACNFNSFCMIFWEPKKNEDGSTSASFRVAKKM